MGAMCARTRLPEKDGRQDDETGLNWRVGWSSGNGWRGVEYGRGNERADFGGIGDEEEEDWG